MTTIFKSNGYKIEFNGKSTYFVSNRVDCLGYFETERKAKNFLAKVMQQAVFKMTHSELKQRFEVAGKSARDFIRWAEAHGVKVHDATVSRHLAGMQGITGPWVLAYRWFFSFYGY